MADAKQCDRCKQFYPDEDFSAMPYKIQAADDKPRDLCRLCLYELEAFMDEFPGRGKKQRKHSEWSEENLEAAAKRQSLRTEIAKLLQEGSDMTWPEAVAKGALRIRKAKEQGVSMEELKKSIERTTKSNKDRGSKKPMCPMCDKNKVNSEGEMCQQCQEDWNEYNKNK